jgi:hypothetical protein
MLNKSSPSPPRKTIRGTRSGSTRPASTPLIVMTRRGLLLNSPNALTWNVSSPSVPWKTSGPLAAGGAEVAMTQTLDSPSGT